MATGLENFEIYKLAERLEIYCHKILKTFPRSSFRIIDQLKRSSSSVADNIAEGYARYAYRDKRNKFIIARAEASETQYGFIRAHKKNLLPESVAETIDAKYRDLIKMINGYRKFLNKKITA